MRQLFLEKGVLAIKEVCQPELDDHSILVSVSFSYMTMGLGLTKVVNYQEINFFENIPGKVSKIFEILKQKGFNNTRAAIKDRINGNVVSIGHSCSGTVIGVGKKIKKFRLGDHVACVGAGFAYHADVICVPENLSVLVEENLLKESSIVGLGSIAVQAVRRAKIELGDSVIVFGADPLGQLIAKMAQIAGGNVAVVEPDEHRRNFLKNDEFFFDIKEAIISTFNFETLAFGVDCLIITPNCLQEVGIEKILNTLRVRGRIVIVGEAAFKIPENIGYQKEIEIIFALSYGPGRHDPTYEFLGQDYPFSFVRWTENRNMQFFIEMVKKKQIDLTSFLVNQYDIKEIDYVFRRLKNEEILSSVIKYENKINISYTDIKALSPSIILANKENYTVSLYGINNQIKQYILPIFEKIPHLIFNEIIDKDSATVLNAVKNFKSMKAVSGGIQQCIESSSDVIMISPSARITINDLISLAKHGKVVAISRPVSKNLDDHDLFSQFLQNNPQVVIAVGYGRTFTYQIKKIKKMIERRKSPLIISYRINSPKLNITQRLDPEWAVGKVIAQASHVVDIFYYLVDHKPTSISVDAMKSDINSFPSDNFVATICFADGSIATLTLTSNGCYAFGSERMEISCDGGTIICDDFLELKTNGLGNPVHIIEKNSDYGYQELFTNFFAGLSKDPIKLPVDYARMLLVEKITLIIDQLISNAGGDHRF